VKFRHIFAPIPLLAAPFAEAALPYRVEAPQWESILAPVYVDQRWEYLAAIRDLKGVNGVTVSVMDEDGKPGKNPDILAWSEADFISARGVFTWLRDHGIHPSVNLASAEHNEPSEWRNINGNRWRPLGRDARLAVLGLTLPLVAEVPVTLNLGEEWDSDIETAREMALWIRTARPDATIAMGNPHTGNPRTRAIAAAETLHREGLLDLLLYQSGPGEQSAPPLPRFYGVEKNIAALSVPVLLHERFDGNRFFDIEDALAWATIPGAVGMSIYPGYRDRCNDLFCVDVLDWLTFYEELDRRRRAEARAAFLQSRPVPAWAIRALPFDAANF
jgi:hypothetical protein